MIKPWPLIQSTPRGDFRIFRLREDRKESPRTGLPYDFLILECVDWVNVIALTEDRHLVMVEQFRHGTNSVELEVPGGTIDAGDRSPVEAAVRELREETGYTGECARVIGRIASNPAIMTNACHTVLIENCRLTDAIAQDGGEDLTTRLVAASDVPVMVARHQIRHSLVAVALYHFELWQRGLKEGAPAP